MVKEIHGRARYGKKNGQAGRSFDLVLKMFGLRATELMNCCKLEQVSTKEHGNIFLNVFRSLKMAGSLPRKRGIGRLTDQKEGLQWKNAGNCGMSSKREDSWHKEVCGTSLGREDVGRQRSLAQRRRQSVAGIPGCA